MGKEQMIDSARRSLEAVLGLKADEHFLVITDVAKLPIGEAFEQAAARMGCATTMHVLSEAARPLAKLPPDLVEAMAPADVAVTCFSGMADETPFRVALIRKLVEDKPRRLGHAPGITEEMMVDGPMNIDFAMVKERAFQLISALRNASHAHITAPGGTDVTLYIEHRPFDTDVVVEPGKFGNLPCGEVWCAPVETLGEGVVVCDGSIGDLGAVPAPLTIVIDRGRVKDLKCDDEVFLARVEELLAIDEEASVIGELGIGINPKARITGNMLEDEKAFRTGHIAFGNNEEMPGGRNRSLTHRDFLFREPTIRVHYIDGTASLIVEDGMVDF